MPFSARLLLQGIHVSVRLRNPATFILMHGHFVERLKLYLFIFESLLSVLFDHPLQVCVINGHIAFGNCGYENQILPVTGGALIAEVCISFGSGITHLGM